METVIPEQIGCIVDHRGTIAFISDAIRKYGYTPDELIGARIIELLDLRTTEPWLVTGTEPGKSYTSRLITKDRQPVSVSIHTIGSIVISNGSLEKLHVLRITEEPEKSGTGTAVHERTWTSTVKAGDAKDDDFLTDYYNHLCR